jgi:hypothetical protein
MQLANIRAAAASRSKYLFPPSLMLEKGNEERSDIVLFSAYLI